MMKMHGFTSGVHSPRLWEGDTDTAVGCVRVSERE
jgi:hypothetical protein